LAFGHDIHGVIGDITQHFSLRGVGVAPNPAYGPTIPFLVFFLYQEMFAVIYASSNYWSGSTYPRQ